jgi:nucleotide-binding universal stress UspA family protein
MNKVYACIDGQSNTHAVIDWGAWCARQLALPLEFLHVLERHPEHSDSRDYSGAIGVDAQASLLQALSDADRLRSKKAQEAGRELLAAARARAAATGVTALDVRLRHGEFVDTVHEMQPDAALLVLGEHPHAAGLTALRVDHHVEQVIRRTTRPVLVAASEAFDAPRRIVLAFDGAAAARRTVDTLARSPWLAALLAGLPVHLLRVGDDAPSARRQIDEACATLRAAGFATEAELRPGAPQQVLPDVARAQGPALLLMGAFSHSRLHQWVRGSTTQALLRLSGVPMLVLR